MKYNNKCGLFVPDKLIGANCFDCNLCMNNEQNRICDESLESIHYPILINWNIIGKCMNRCQYCYGKNIYESSFIEEISRLDIVISNIKQLHPKVVVISGGEPLLHPELIYINDSLNQFTHTIIDTNGLLINDDFIKHFKKYNTHVRISLDDHRELINGRIRISKQNNSTDVIIYHIEKLQKNSIPFTVQSVLSPLNKDYIIEFGEYLLMKRIKNWRIHRLIPRDYFNPGDNGTWMSMCLKKIEQFAQNNRDRIIIRVSNGDHQGKSLINIEPSGNITTRPTNSLQSEVLGNIYYDCIEVSSIIKKIDKMAHMERYYKEYAALS